MTIDIEKLAIENKVYVEGKDIYKEYRCGERVLKQFAEAYHKAMCEQSEPVAWTDEHRNFLEWDKDSLIDKSCCKDTEAIPLFTSPQKPQPLKRLSDKAIGDCLNKAELPTIMLNPIVVEKLDNFANAIMDEMERINK